jgi:hypothetical protein
MPPRALAASLVAVLVPLGAGCGVGAGGDEDDVRRAVKSYIAASLQGNGKQACAFYTKELRAEVRRTAKHACPRVVGKATRTRLAQLPFDVRDEVESTFADADEIDVDVIEGTRATATLEMPHGVMADTRLRLVRTPEGWRIDGVD